MPLLITVNFLDKELWYWPQDATGPLQVLLPDGVTPTGRPASIASHKGRSYILGAFSSPICFDEAANATIMGLLAPSIGPTLAGTSAGNVDGAALGYYAYRYKIGSRIVTESNLSPDSGAVTFTNDMAQWSALLPSPDRKATHLVTYRAMEGGLPRESGERQIGTTGFIENRAELALGAPPPNDGEEVNGNRGVPPWGQFCEVFHQRLWIAGDPRYPFRAWYSEVNELEAFGALGYIDTLEGEPITGIKKHRDTLVITCRRCLYVVRGYTRDDFKIDKVDPQIGCVSHFSIVNVNNVLVWASEEGVVGYDGGKPKYLMEDLRNFWRDEFEEDPTPFQNSLAAFDPKEQVYKLLTPRLTAATNPDDPVSDDNPPVSPRSVYYCCDMGDAGLYHWFFDKRDRIDSALGVLADGHLVTGSSDGFVRLENQYGDVDDDGDTHVKALLIRTGHMLFGDPGGDSEDGKKITNLWTYVTSEVTAWVLRCLGGDEEAWQQLQPDNDRNYWKDDVAASALSQTVEVGLEHYTQVAIPQSVHPHLPQRVTGRGLTVEIAASSVRDFRYLGFGGNYGPEKAPRKSLSETILPNSAALDAVSFWHLEEASGTRVDAYAANNLTDNNTVTQASGIVGNAARFTAANSEYLAIADISQISLNPGTGDFSISLWFYPIATTGSGDYYLVSKGATGSNSFAPGYSILARGTTSALASKVSVFFGDGVSATRGCQFHSTDTYNLNAWNHLVVTFDRDGSLSVWLNFVAQAASSGSSALMSAFASSTGACSPNAPFAVGAFSQNGGGSTGSYYDGRIDAVGVWNRLLTADEAEYLWYEGAGKELTPAA
jgi:hypothetical protein